MPKYRRERSAPEALAQPLDGLDQAGVLDRQRDAEEALAVRAVGGAGRYHHARLLQHELAVRLRGVALRDRRPDVDGPLRRGDVDADLAQRVDDEVAPALVHGLHLANGRTAQLEGGCRG